jgi:hypothetical protein
MASRPELQDPEPISPELVLVSPPDVARRAREELREPPSLLDTPPAVRDRLPEPPPRAAVPEPPPRAAVAPPPPVRPKRRRGRIALVGVAIAAAVAAVAYVVVGRDNPRRASPAAANAPGGSAPASTVGATPTPTTATRRARVERRQATTTSRPAKRATQAGKPAAKPKRAAKAASKPRQARKPAAKPKQAGKPKRTTERPAGAPSTGFVPARTWTWPESKGARAYETRFMRDGHLVLDMRTTQPRLVLPRTFTFRAGTYRWIVRRIPPGASQRPIVDSTFALSRAAAARANP